MTPVLEIESLSAGYGPLRVLHDLDLSVFAGERVAIVGLNGHGKSTLLQSIVGLVGWQQGSIRLDGVQIGGQFANSYGRRTHRVVRRGVALMPQGDAIFPGLTVRQHLDSGAYTRSAWRTRARRRDELLSVFTPLQKLLDTPVGKLSGGERRMVSLSRGLMADSKLLLVDEPTLGLAPIVSASVVRSLLDIDLGDRAMVIAEQNLKVLEGRVTRVLSMHAGRIRGGVGARAIVAD